MCVNGSRYSESFDWVSTVEPVGKSRLRVDVQKERGRVNWYPMEPNKRYAHATTTMNAKGTFREYR